MTDASWQEETFARIKSGGVDVVGYVPDAGLAGLIDLARADTEIADVVLTSEQEGVALCAGAWLGGKRSVLLMQSSGVGNCINMLSLQTTARFPMVIVVAMRGEHAEFNPWQIPMGSTTQAALELCGFKVERVEREGEAADTVEAAIDFAYASDIGVAVLLSQKMIGRKKWVE
jgi:sulfopyruvate decarboxylase alpha subunit